MADEIKRLYNFEDELMITRARTQKGNLQTDLALFTARFPWVDAVYVTSYQTDIDTADALPLDGTVMADITVLTSDVNASVAEGVAALNSLFRYAVLSYPTDKVRQRVFGQDRMEKARNDQEKMENLLEHANSMANKNPYKADLIAKGYTQLQIDGLLTISNNISAKNTLQEGAKSNRPVSTQDRITVYNIVFSRMRTIALCAEEVFAGNPAKIEQYRAYPPGTAAATTAIVHIIDGSANDMAGLDVKITSLPAQPAQPTNAAGLTGSFDLGSNPPDTVDIEVTGAGINPSPQVFNGNSILEGEVNSIELVVTV